VIHWTPVSCKTLTPEVTAHVFALSHNGRILFFGYSLHSSLQEEVNRTIKRCKLNADEVILWLGQFNQFATMDKQLIEEVMCLMVFTTQPLYNIICKASYYGREGLTVQNTGCLLLKTKVFAPVKTKRYYKGIV